MKKISVLFVSIFLLLIMFGFAETNKLEARSIEVVYINAEYYGGYLTNGSSIDTKKLDLYALINEDGKDSILNLSKSIGSFDFKIDEELIDIENYKFSIENEEDESQNFFIDVTYDEYSTFLSVSVCREVNTYEVTFTAGDGVGADKKITAVEGEAILLSVPDFEAPSEKVFDKWSDGTDSYYYKEDRYWVYDNKTLVALYKSDEKVDASVSLDLGEYSSSIAKSMIVEDVPAYINAPRGPVENKGYLFVYWVVNGQVYYPGNRVRIYDDTVLKAIYTVDDREDPFNFSVSYNGANLKVGDKIKLTDVTISIKDGETEFNLTSEKAKFVAISINGKYVEDLNKYEIDYSAGSIDVMCDYGFGASLFTVLLEPTIWVYLDACNDGDNVESFLINVGSDYIIPNCPFKAPEGTKFAYWEMDGEKYYPGDKVEAEEINLYFSAVYTDKNGEVVNPVEPENHNDETPKAKNHAGLYAFIIIGGVLVLGLGAFAIYWFVIKKKSFKDLAKALKK